MSDLTAYEAHLVETAARRYDALQRVRNLHTPCGCGECTSAVCRACGHPWPCQTIRVMDE